MRPKVIFKNVGKTYSIFNKQSDYLKDFLLFKRNNKKYFQALRSISFEVMEGESIGVIGLNGAGKSTLANLIAQVVPPTSGEIVIKGEPSLISINVGLNNQLTGLENIRMKCLLHGLKIKQIEKILPSIIDFAEIGNFINQPIKNYSSGMKSRLGFAIAIHINPDILIIDEALSVGDSTYYHKCLNRIEQFKKEGKTIFFISHSDNQIKHFCDKVLWLENGVIKAFGEANEVVGIYSSYIRAINKLPSEEKKLFLEKKLEEQFNIKKKDKLKQLDRFSIGELITVLVDFILFLTVFAFAFLMLFNS